MIYAASIGTLSLFSVGLVVWGVIGIIKTKGLN